jgi:hypothetical protein
MERRARDSACYMQMDLGLHRIFRVLLNFSPNPAIKGTSEGALTLVLVTSLAEE